MNAENGISVDDINKSLKRFGLVDYVVFAVMLMMCSLVGIYFGYEDHKKRQQRKLKSRRGSGELDYLVGGRNMQTFPVAMSLVASGLSGITLLGKLYLISTSRMLNLPPSQACPPRCTFTASRFSTCCRLSLSWDCLFITSLFPSFTSFKSSRLMRYINVVALMLLLLVRAVRRCNRRIIVTFYRLDYNFEVIHIFSIS